jgi:hypothetical protein
MKIWMSGEIQSTVSKQFRFALLAIEPAFNEYFGGLSFGSGLVEIDYLPIIREIESDDFDEVKRYTKKDRSAEFRLKIPYEMCLKADQKEMTILMLASLRRAVGILQTMKIKDFDAKAFGEEFDRFLDVFYEAKLADPE